MSRDDLQQRIADVLAAAQEPGAGVPGGRWERRVRAACAEVFDLGMSVGWDKCVATMDNRLRDLTGSTPGTEDDDGDDYDPADFAGCALAYNEHSNELGDWCPWSGQEGKPDAERGDPCPAGCPESRAMEEDDQPEAAPPGLREAVVRLFRQASRAANAPRASDASCLANGYMAEAYRTVISLIDGREYEDEYDRYGDQE